MIRASVIPTQRRRWPGAFSIALALLAAALLAATLKADSASQTQIDAAALNGFDQGYAAAMNQLADTVGAAYSTGYRAAQREASAVCPSQQQGGRL